MVESNDSCIYSLDQELSASVKKILLQRIAFKDAQIPDEGDNLNHKYKPLNGRYNLHLNSLKLNQSSKSSAVQSDIPKPPTLIYPVEKVELEWKEMRRIGPGLANLGNTCFLNSVLQVLTYTPPLVNYMLSDYHKNKCRIVGFCMQCELAAHINRVMRHNTQIGAIRPMSIIQKLQCIGKNFRFGRQEDAHEFLRYVVEGIQKSDYADKPKLDKLSKETTVANAIFGGFYRSQVKCLHCHYESNTFDPMMDLNMDIKDCSSIIQTLQKSVRPDRLDGENKYFCEKCRTKRVAQKRGNIHKEPNVLTLQLKRFDFSKMFGGKICKEVSFPEELNIRPFMSNTQGEPVFYKLYGILVHSGYSCNSGHYYCYVKAPNGTWYEMNDNRVCQVGLQTVLQAQAYILFYVKSNQNKRLTNILSSISKGGVVKSVVQRPEAKPCGLSDLDKQRSSIDTKDPLGVLLRRKPEPKINWAHNQKEKLGVANVQSMLNIPSNKRNVEESCMNANKEKSGYPTKESDEKLSSHNTHTQEKVALKETAMNGLQKLSESYGDSDGVGSRAPSPTSNKLMEDLEFNQSDKEVKKTENTVVEATNLTNDIEMEYNSKKETQESKPPFKLKLKNGKQFIHNKLNIWSPITKGTLYPRAILNKCVLDNESDQSKVHLSARKKKLPVVDSSWKEENISHSEKLFGPLMPPPPGTKCHGSNSITSEASSTGSIQTQSGEWDVLDKGCEACSPIVPDLQHAGWNVCPTSHNTSNISGDENQVITNDIDDSKSKKKKKKKKKHRHRNEEFITGQVELKQKFCISINKSGSRKEPIHNSDKLENIGRHESKKKKRAIKENIQLQSTLSLPSSCLLPASSDTEEIHHKKKKKKHKQKHYSFMIDTNTNNIGRLYNIPCSIEKQLPKFKVKSSNKPEIMSNDSSFSKMNEYKSNFSSKVAHKNDYSPSLRKSSSFHPVIEKEGILYEKSLADTRKVDILNSSIDGQKVYFLPNKSDKQNSKDNSASARETSTQRRTSENNHDKNIMHYSKNNSHSLQLEDRPLYDKSGGLLSTSNSANSESNHTLKTTSVSPTMLQHSESNVRSSTSPTMHLHSESNTRLQEANQNIDSFPKSTINGPKSHSLSLKREEGIQSMKTVGSKDENSSPTKREAHTHIWDEPKKKHCSWDGSNKSDTVEYLLAGGSKVKSWDGSDKSYLYNAKNHVDGENVQDEWDEEYDKGKLKKKRKLNDDRDYRKSKSNSFQDFQNYRNHSKDKHTPRSAKHQNLDRRYQSKKRKLYSEDNRFV